MQRLLPFLVCALALSFAPAALAADTAEEPPPAETPAADTQPDDVPADEPATDQPAESAPPAEPDFMSLLGDSTEDQRARMLRFIRNRYPNMAVELLALLQSRQPGIFVALERELQTLIASRYPRLTVEVQKILQQAINNRYPQVRNEIAELIARDYPDLIEAMGETGAGDPAMHTARLIRERHRELLEDVLALLREQHPTLLQEVQREVLVKHPELLADVSGLIAERYPLLSAEITCVLTEKYPELIPGMLKILAPPPAEEEASAEQ
ncbi:MAG: hypothetical protein GF393_12170 [Armatimonadia bacterium]|nr:hypothetical protein [Armatimonadia bacterium]